MESPKLGPTRPSHSIFVHKLRHYVNVVTARLSRPSHSEHYVSISISFSEVMRLSVPAFASSLPRRTQEKSRKTSIYRLLLKLVWSRLTAWRRRNVLSKLVFFSWLSQDKPNDEGCPVYQTLSYINPLTPTVALWVQLWSIMSQTGLSGDLYFWHPGALTLSHELYPYDNSGRQRVKTRKSQAGGNRSRNLPESCLQLHVIHCVISIKGTQ